IDLVGGADRGLVVLDARQRLGIGRDLLLRQTLDALNLVILFLDRQVAALALALARHDLQRRMRRRLTRQAENERAVGRDADVAAVECDLCPRHGLAVNQPALLQRSVERQRVGESGDGDEQQHRQEKISHNSLPCLVVGVATSTLPSWNSSDSVLSGFTLAASVTSLPLASRTIASPRSSGLRSA